MPEIRTNSMDALLDAYIDRTRALRRVLWVIAHHPDSIVADPSLVLQAIDASPSTIGWCPSGCTGDCTPEPALKARLDSTAAQALEG